MKASAPPAFAACNGFAVGKLRALLTPATFAIALLSLGMLALFLDLAHKLYVWRIYVAFEPSSPMSWGSWVLLLVYPVILVSALIRLPQAWPWLGERLPILQRLSDAIVSSPGKMKLLGILNIGLGIALGIYTGILLSTMVARPCAVAVMSKNTISSAPCSL